MNVLSLFDGMGCGMIAILNAGVNVDRYVAYEIDKYAVKTSAHNFPTIEHMGDVFGADFTQYAGFDWLIGGSPCTYWSIAQTKNRETTASGTGWELFSQYVRALKEARPKYFIYENNKSMSQAIRDSISLTFGFEPVCINSALVSAQNRQRLYWMGKRQADGSYKKVNVKQPTDKGVLLKDIVDKKYNYNLIINKPFKAVPGKNSGVVATLSINGLDSTRRVYGLWGKSPTLTSCGGGQREPKVLQDGLPRKLSVDECKRLQTVPDWYEFPVSNTQAYKMLGNGWTCDVITHLIKSCLQESEELTLF